jgi:hypothetical protein
MILVITYISVNFLLLILLRDSEYYIKRLLIFHIIVLLFLFIKGIVLFLKNKNKMIEKGQNIKDSGARQGFYASAFNRSSGHGFLCYSAIFYIFVSIYFFYLLYKGKIVSSNSFIIIIIVIVGLMIALKEAYTQFSQCINASQNGATIPYCDNHYYKYWNCIHNEYYTNEEELPE